MAVLKVVECKNNKRVVLFENSGCVYDAGGLFFELDKFDLEELQEAKLLYSEDMNYNSSSLSDKTKLVDKVVQLENRYGINIFNNSARVLNYWVVMNRVSNARNI